MSRLMLALVLLFGAVLLGCSGNEGTEPQVAGDIFNDSQNDQPAMGGSEQGNSRSSGNAQPSGKLSCSENSSGSYSTPEEAVLAQACYKADFLEEIDFEPTLVEVSNNTGRTATGRVVGYSESCLEYCPGEIQITFELFKSSGGWETKSEWAGGRFEKSNEQVEVAAQEDLENLSSVSLVIYNTAPELDEGDFCTEIDITGIETFNNFWIGLLVDLPNGQSGMQYSWYGFNGEEACFADDRASDGLYKVDYDIYKWNGVPVDIQAYRFGTGDSGEIVLTEWIYIEN